MRNTQTTFVISFQKGVEKKKQKKRKTIAKLSVLHANAFIFYYCFDFNFKILYYTFAVCFFVFCLAIIANLLTTFFGKYESS